MEHLDIINSWKKIADLSAYGRLSSLMDLFVILNSYGINASDKDVTDSIVSCFDFNIENFYLKGKFKQYLLQDIASAYIITIRDNTAKNVKQMIPLKVESVNLKDFDEYESSIKEIDPNQEMLDMRPEDFKEMEFDLDYCKLLGEDDGR